MIKIQDIQFSDSLIDISLASLVVSGVIFVFVVWAPDRLNSAKESTILSDEVLEFLTPNCLLFCMMLADVLFNNVPPYDDGIKCYPSALYPI